MRRNHTGKVPHAFKACHDRAAAVDVAHHLLERVSTVEVYDIWAAAYAGQGLGLYAVLGGALANLLSAMIAGILL